MSVLVVLCDMRMLLDLLAHQYDVNSPHSVLCSFLSNHFALSTLHTRTTIRNHMQKLV